MEDGFSAQARIDCKFSDFRFSTIQREHSRSDPSSPERKYTNLLLADVELVDLLDEVGSLGQQNSFVLDNELLETSEKVALRLLVTESEAQERLKTMILNIFTKNIKQ